MRGVKRLPGHIGGRDAVEAVRGEKKIAAAVKERHIKQNEKKWA